MWLGSCPRGSEDLRGCVGKRAERVGVFVAGQLGPETNSDFTFAPKRK